MLPINFSSLYLYNKTRIVSVTDEMPVTVSTSNATKHCNKAPTLRNIQNEAIDLSKCITEFFCNCESNYHVAATISSDCVSILFSSHFLKVLMVVCGNILYF